MKTNFEITKELIAKHKPEKRGFASPEEIEKVMLIAELTVKTKLELQNLRDFFSLYVAPIRVQPDDPQFDPARDRFLSDLASHVTAIIDEAMA